MLAALRRQEIDQRAIAADNPRLRASPGAHPFLAKRQNAGPRRIGCIVTLNHPLDEWRSRSYCAPAKCRPRKSATDMSSVNVRQRRVKLGLRTRLRRAAGQRSAFEGPSLSFDRLQREAALRAAGHG